MVLLYQHLILKNRTNGCLHYETRHRDLKSFKFGNRILVDKNASVRYYILVIHSGIIYNSEPSESSENDRRSKFWNWKKQIKF